MCNLNKQKIVSLVLSFAIAFNIFTFAVQANGIQSKEANVISARDKKIPEKLFKRTPLIRQDHGPISIGETKKANKENEVTTQSTAIEIGSFVDIGKSTTKGPATKTDNGVDKETSVDSGTVTASEVPSTLVQMYNSLTRPSMINNIKNPHFTGRNASSVVSPFNGDLQLNFTDLSLPGKNGLDLNLNRFYQSSHAAMEHEAVRVDTFNNNFGEMKINPSTYYNDRYALGIGWSFGFPSVEIRKETSNTEMFYHDGTGGSYRVNSKDPAGGQGAVYSANLDNYYTDDAIFNYNDTSYTRDTYTSKYSFQTPDKRMQYFGKYGEILSIKDRFNNEIKFDYATIPGKNLNPFFNCNTYNLETYWSAPYNDLLVWNNTTASNKTSTAYVTPTKIDDKYTQYYVSLLYDTDSFFSGGFEVDYDITDVDNAVLDSGTVLTQSVTPTSNAVKVDGNITITPNLYDYTGDLYIHLKIKVNSARNKIEFGDIRISPYMPLISKITDTIGRTLEFTYTGDVYERYKDSEGNTIHPNLPIDITVKDVDGTIFRTISYDRNVYSFTSYLGDDAVAENNVFQFWGADNGDYYSWVDYDFSNEGWYSFNYTLPNIYKSYSYYGNPLVKQVVQRNSSTYYTYGMYDKLTTVRDSADNILAIGFEEPYRVISSYDVNDSVSATPNPNLNTTNYRYDLGTYDDDTRYVPHPDTNHILDLMEPGDYTVQVTQSNGTVNTYEYFERSFNGNGKLKKGIVLPLVNKQTTAASSGTTDNIVKQYEYNHQYAITSPTRILTTETINGTSRQYGNSTTTITPACLHRKPCR